MAADLPSLVDDLVAESAALDAVLERLRPPQWSLSTLAAGWTVGDQVSHLAYFDEATLQSLTDPDQFRREAEVLTSGGDGLPDRIAAQHRGRPGAGLLSWFRDAASGARGGLPHRRPWAPAALVRTGHEPGFVGHGEAHGDVGARPGHPRRARHRPGPDSPVAPHRRPGHPRRAVQLRRQPSPVAEGADQGRAERTGRRRVDLGATRRPGSGRRQRDGFLPCCHAAEAPGRQWPGRHRSHGPAVDRHRAGVRRTRRTWPGTAGCRQWSRRTRYARTGAWRAPAGIRMPAPFA